MAYNTKNIIRDAAGAPVPQFYNPTTDAYEVIQGSQGGNRVLLYDANGTPLLTAANPGYVQADDGKIVSLGAKADAAVIDPTLSASEIALLKGLMKQLQGAGTGTAPVTVNANKLADVVILQNAAVAVGVGTAMTVSGAGVATLGVSGTFVATVTWEGQGPDGTWYTINARNRSTGAIGTTTTVTGLYEVNCRGLTAVRANITAYTSGNVTVKGTAQSLAAAADTFQLAGSSVTDSQAVPTTQAQKDYSMKAYENIIDIIGAENIKLLLPMWETSGTTFRDLLRSDMTFTGNGVTLAQPGTLHPIPSFDGVNDCIIRDSITQNTAGVADIKMDGPTIKLATRMVAVATIPGFVRLKVKRLGTLNNATIQVSFFSDNAGAPNALVGATSTPLACSVVNTYYENRGFVIPTPPNLQKNQNYWIVLEYAALGGDTVDANNCIIWCCEQGANTYGQRRAVYNGATWTATDTENHVFGLWDDRLILDGDFSVIVPVLASHSDVSTRYIFTTCGMVSAESPSLGILYHSAGNIYTYAYDSVLRSGIRYRYPLNQFNIWGLTFSKAKDTAKITTYQNGMSTGTINGGLNTALTPQAQPLTIGANVSASGLNAYFMQGRIGPFITTKNELTAANMAKVTNQLLALRRLQVGL